MTDKLKCSRCQIQGDELGIGAEPKALRTMAISFLLLALSFLAVDPSQPGHSLTADAANLAVILFL